MKKLLSLCVALIVFSVAVLADVRPPETPKPKANKSIETYFSIKLDKNAKEAKLVIPKSQLKQLRAELEELDNEQDGNTATTNGFSRTQTVVGGMFMSLAVLFGGVWFTRSRKIDTKSGKTLIAGAVLFSVGSLATIAFANVGPPNELRQITGKLFDKKVFGYWSSAGGKIKLEVSDKEQSPQLIVPDVAEEKKTTNEE